MAPCELGNTVSIVMNQTLLSNTKLIRISIVAADKSIGHKIIGNPKFDQHVLFMLFPGYGAVPSLPFCCCDAFGLKN